MRLGKVSRVSLSGKLVSRTLISLTPLPNNIFVSNRMFERSTAMCRFVLQQCNKSGGTTASFGNYFSFITSQERFREEDFMTPVRICSSHESNIFVCFSQRGVPDVLASL